MRGPGDGSRAHELKSLFCKAVGLFMTNDPMALSGRSAYLGLQHALASMGGIITAPLIIALGMGLNEAQTAYVIAAALVVSGLATIIQIVRVGPIGSGLLSIQGTSFAFVGTSIYVFHQLTEILAPEQALGTLFGSMIVCSVLMMGLAWFVRSMSGVITTNVTGVTLMMIGLSLVWSSASSLVEGYQAQALDALDLGLAGLVAAVIIVSMLVPMASIRSISVILGLGAGCVAAILMDRFTRPDSASSDLSFFTPEVLPFGFGIEPVMVLIMMPIFIVSATESIGDLTATNRLSGHRHGDESYWLRIRGGLMGDSLNSGLAGVLGTFPNTTFSQNNGVIRATGASNPVIGIYAAVVLIGLGMLPATIAWIQAIPETVVKGMTLVLFGLVVFAGFSIVRSAAPRVYDYVGVVIAGVMGIAIAETISEWSFLPAVVISTFSFSVTNAALLMILIDRALKRIR